MNIDEADQSELIGYLLASVVEESNLQSFTDKLVSLCDDRIVVALRRIDVLTKCEDVAGFSGIDADSIDSFVNYYASRNAYQEPLTRIPLNAPQFALAHVDRRAIAKSEIYNDWKRPLGLGIGGLAINVARSGRYVLSASIEMSDALEEAAGRGFEALLGRLAPHLATLADLNGKAWAKGVSAALDTSATGALLVSHVGRVIHMNEAAERLLWITGLNVDAKGKLCGATPEADGTVQAVLGDVLAGRSAARTASPSPARTVPTRRASPTMPTPTAAWM